MLGFQNNSSYQDDYSAALFLQKGQGYNLSELDNSICKGMICNNNYLIFTFFIILTKYCYFFLFILCLWFNAHFCVQIHLVIKSSMCYSLIHFYYTFLFNYHTCYRTCFLHILWPWLTLTLNLLNCFNGIIQLQ